MASQSETASLPSRSRRFEINAIARNQRLPGWLVQPERKVFCTSKPAWPINLACSEQTLHPAGQAGTGSRSPEHVFKLQIMRSCRTSRHAAKCIQLPPAGLEAVPLLGQRFSGYFGANSLTSRAARTDPPVKPAGFQNTAGLPCWIIMFCG